MYIDISVIKCTIYHRRRLLYEDAIYVILDISRLNVLVELDS